MPTTKLTPHKETPSIARDARRALLRILSPVERSVEIIGGKWKLNIVTLLLEKEVLRFGELKNLVHGITVKMLAQQLRFLEMDGLIERRSYHEVPPRVDYRLTAIGLALRPTIRELQAFGVEVNRLLRGE